MIACVNKEIYKPMFIWKRNLIQSATNRNRLVIFVGAGVSIPFGVPSWKELVRKLFEHLGDSIDDENFLKIFSIVIMNVVRTIMWI